MSIDITDQQEPCFALLGGACKVLEVPACDGCRFYKPKATADWVRIERYGRVYVVPPEVFFKEE